MTSPLLCCRVAQDMPPALAGANVHLLHLASNGMMPGSCSQVDDDPHPE